MAIRAMENVLGLKYKEEGLREIVGKFVNQKLSETHTDCPYNPKRHTTSNDQDR